MPTIHVQRSIQMEKNEIAVQAKLQLDARDAELWSKQSKMYLNYYKTTCMRIGTRYRTHNSQQLNIYIDNSKIKSVDKQISLGIYIDENLLWSDHIDYLCSNISSKSSVVVVVALLFYVHGKHLRSCRNGQLT